VIQDQTAKLRRVYVRAPRPDDLVAWESYGWRERPDPARAKEDHTKLRAELEKAGVEISCLVHTIEVVPISEEIEGWQRSC